MSDIRLEVKKKVAPPTTVVDMFLDWFEQETGGLIIDGLKDVLSDYTNIEYDNDTLKGDHIHGWFFEGPREWLTTVDHSGEPRVGWMNIALSLTYWDEITGQYLSIARWNCRVNKTDPNDIVIKTPSYINRSMLSMIIRRDMEEKSKKAMGDELGGLLDL